MEFVALHVCAREVDLAEGDGIVHLRVVVGLGRAVVGRRCGQGDGEIALRHSVRPGSGLGLQGDHCRILVDAHDRLVPADGDGYEVVVGDLYGHSG